MDCDVFVSCEFLFVIMMNAENEGLHPENKKIGTTRPTGSSPKQTECSEESLVKEQKNSTLKHVFWSQWTFR